ncbi:MAG: sigma-70 family RNA polymerase sigma factor [Micropepsaceae bacterium]
MNKPLHAMVPTMPDDLESGEPETSGPENGGRGEDSVDTEFRNGLIDLLPFLRAFSRTLCGHRELADDLAQEALVKAWQARDSFRLGSNLKAWLFTILRNLYYSDRRRAWRQAPWDDAAAERVPNTQGEQSWAAELTDTARAMSMLPAEQREALILVGAGGFSYEDAAKISGCAIGTVKSRVARARRAVIATLDGLEPLTAPRRFSGQDATHEIMAQLDRLAPGDETGKNARDGPKGRRPGSR